VKAHLETKSYDDEAVSEIEAARMVVGREWITVSVHVDHDGRPYLDVNGSGLLLVQPRAANDFRVYLEER